MQSIPKLEVKLLNEQFDLRIPEEQLRKIQFLCRKINKVEWSGILFYFITGTMRDLSTVSFKVADILLMDKGDGASTAYDFDGDVADFIMDKTMENPDWMSVKIGHIHSHHNMGKQFAY